jgi:hypothetical protein
VGSSREASRLETNSFFFSSASIDTGDYGALDRFYCIDVVASSAAGSIVITDKAPLETGRGDVAAAVDLENGYAYVSGGWTHKNDFCTPIGTAERYSIAANTWTEVANLPTPRADLVLVVLKEHVIAMGGERQPENICEIQKPDPGEMTVPVDDVEVMNHDGTEWNILTSMPDHRFRFAAVVIDDAIYTFGGQLPYEEICNCHATTDEVAVYKYLTVESVPGAADEDTGSSSAAFANSQFAVIAAFGAFGWVL